MQVNNLLVFAKWVSNETPFLSSVNKVYKGARLQMNILGILVDWLLKT